MILLIGNNRDDLLYFETIISNKKTEYVLDKYPVTIGTISNQAVILISNIYTNILSSLIVSHLIEKYYVLFVIKVSREFTLSKTFKNGDVVVSKKVKSLDVDITDLQGTVLGQIPGFEDVYDTNNEICTTLIEQFTKRTPVIVKDSIVYSSNVHYIEPSQLSQFVYDGKIMGDSVDGIVFDSEAFGIATACALYQIPFVSLGVIINHIGEEFDTDDYVNVLRKYTYVGKAVVSAIGEIGSNEVLRG